MNRLGDVTQSEFLKDFYGNDIFQEFEANAAIKKGQPVVLTTDGKITPAGAASNADIIIGTSIHEAGANEFATVALKARAIQWMNSGAALNAGKVEYNGYDSGAERHRVIQESAAGKLLGYALDQAAGADELIRVAIL